MTILVMGALLMVTHPVMAIQTGKVELGRNGSYDGTVWITRNTSGSLVFRDQQVGTSVTLMQLLGWQNDHGSLLGLADDDHVNYLNAARHWQTHTAAYNDELPIPPDVGNHSTLGGHTGGGDIHVIKNGAETIGGAWRFTGTPVFAPSLRIEPVAPNPNGSIDFGTGYSAPRISYLGAVNEFEFSRPIRTTSGSLTDLVGSRFRVWTNLDGRGVTGQPAATLTNFVSVNGVAAGNLLDRSVNEDITGQWDFLSPVHMLDDVTFEDATASGVLTTVGIAFTTQTEAAEVSGMFSRLESTSPSIALLLDKNNNTPSGWKRFKVFAGDHKKNPAWDFESLGDSGILTFMRNSDAYSYLRISADSSGPVFGCSIYARTWWNYNGDIINYLNSNNGSNYFRIRDSGGADVWTCNSKGNVAMAANAKQTIPDGTDAPFIYTFNACANRCSDDRETLGPITCRATGLEYDGDGFAYFAFPIPNDTMGADVVLDRITVYCSQHEGSGERIEQIALVDDTDSVVRSSSGPITGDTQWLSSDYTMNDSRSYVLRVQFAQYSSGHLQLTRFKVEYHLE
jgi:hypothetical protein